MLHICLNIFVEDRAMSACRANISIRTWLKINYDSREKQTNRQNTRNKIEMQNKLNSQSAKETSNQPISVEP